MDPLSIATGVAALITVCVEAVRIVKSTIETLKNAKAMLMKLLHEVERMRLLLEQVRSLTLQLQGRSTLLLPFNDSACRETVTELRILVRGVAKQKTFMSLQALLQKSKASQLLQRLHRHEEEIIILMLSIATESSLKTESEVKALTHQATSRAKVISAFDTLSISECSESKGPSNEVSKPVIWPGCMSSSQVDPSYLSLRHMLSEAVYYGNWVEMWEAMKTANERYGQNWVNYPRLKDDPTTTSGWTPLHQSVYLCAPEDVIGRLVSSGALRTLRTLWAPEEFSHRDLTPIEMARDLGYAHLYHLLMPVIRHNVPTKILESLQSQFHAIIKEDTRDLADDQHIRLPELVALTELEIPEMWFPLNPPVQKNKGYVYRLDGRELLVVSYCKGDLKKYRISANSVLEIEDAVVFNAE